MLCQASPFLTVLALFTSAIAQVVGASTGSDSEQQNTVFKNCYIFQDLRLDLLYSLQ